MIAHEPSFVSPSLTLEAVIVSIPHSRPRIRVPALIDIGADITVVYTALVEHPRLYPFNRIELIVLT